MAVRMTGMISGLDTDSLIQSLVEAQKLKNKKTVDKKTKLEWTQDKWKELNTKLYSLYTTEVNKLTLQSSYLTKKASVSDETKVQVKAGATAPLGSQTITITDLASSGYLTGSELESSVTKASTLKDLGISGNATLNLTVGDKSTYIEVDDSMTVATFVSKLQSGGINASYDEKNHRIFLSSKQSGLANDFSLTASTADGTDVLEKTGLAAGSATKIDGQDAKFTLNGVEFTSDTNETTVNGITLTLTEKTTAPVTFTLTNDTQAVYDTIKNFVKKYNEILEEMNKLYYADSARGYDPLSDDEKESMTDSQIEKWETKIKDSLLRRDDTLGGIMSSMKNALLTSVEVDGKRYSLSSFGVGTSSNYLERGLLHIQGDSEDSTYASYTNKLMEALENDPDTVMQVFTGVAQNLYKAMQDKMKKTSLSSALTFYNDTYIKNQLTAYNKQISKDEDKLTEIEDKYYAQFAAMETALAKMQSQQNSLSAYL
jgi:flagellar hook-associated protein 2